MKKLFLAFILLSTAAFAQKRSCCQLTITDQNAMLAANASFAATHIEPLAFVLESPKGEMIRFNTDDANKPGQAYLVKAATQPAKKALFIFHEWWGLNDYIKREAEQLQSEMPGVDVYAIDLYDSEVAGTREEAQKLVGKMTEARSHAIIRGLFAHVGKKVKVATLGWCMGGSWALQAAIDGGKQVKACVMYYGMPESDNAKLKLLKTDVLGIFAEKDNHINVQVVKDFEDRMKAAGKKIVVYNYIAEHAFANPSNPQYNKEATEDAHKKVMVYLKKRMKIKG